MSTPLVIPHNFAAKRRGLERGRPARLSALGSQTSLEGTPRRVGEHLPKRLGVQFKLVWFYYAQRRAGRPRSSPFPLRGIFSSAAKRRGELVWYNEGNTMASNVVLLGKIRL
jgi:hypothetical protein